MQITLNDRTYVVDKVKTRMLRKAIELSEKVNFESIKAKDLDVLIDFVVVLYGNQFTIDDVYDGLEAQELMNVLNDSINGIVGNLGDKLNQFPNK